MVSHPTEQMEAVFPLQRIESSSNLVKVTFVAKEQGFYKIVFSNAHSWMRAKTLKYRYMVLKPVNELLTPEKEETSFLPQGIKMGE
mmetsp:Transcript_17414/g.29304  ORF Transcript_17414/g.29304 Transcript_17414/m.29304 type:complete len:86 (+) Transcript_17414:1672-1929(+)